MLTKFSLSQVFRKDKMMIWQYLSGGRENQIKYLLSRVRIECSELEISYFACIQQLLDGGLLKFLIVVQ